jgi:polyisoprenoid-binding protein YceI
MWHPKLLHGWFLAFLLTAGPPDRLTAQGPIASSTSVTGTLSYDARATLGRFTGSTDSVFGRLNGAPTLARVSGYVAARAATLKTGNGLRDKDQYKSLEVDSFPFIRFDVDSVSPGATSGDTLNVTLHGAFEIHGTRRAAHLPAQLLLTPTSAHLIASTPMDVREYGIEGLVKMLGALRMNPNIVVRIDVVFALQVP